MWTWNCTVCHLLYGTGHQGSIRQHICCIHIGSPVTEGSNCVYRKPYFLSTKQAPPLLMLCPSNCRRSPPRWATRSLRRRLNIAAVRGSPAWETSNRRLVDKGWRAWPAHWRYSARSYDGQRALPGVRQMSTVRWRWLYWMVLVACTIARKLPGPNWRSARVIWRLWSHGMTYQTPIWRSLDCWLKHTLVQYLYD